MKTRTYHTIIVYGVVTDVFKVCRNIREAFEEAANIELLGEILFSFTVVDIEYNIETGAYVKSFTEKFHLDNNLIGGKVA